ncbi:MEDS domain-containing protein [Nocardia sp. CDC159]|uniref:MEDS domain-containing protein n=1 Tax=Nocardia pulmonis TaxID=2951408 RepID=A0A9X2J1L0_9NOCA|nr:MULTISPECIES: MEDS domain-containing protein [Nocardia]MCM6777131.1 MEDS domain-containing protein [Nocardia pulmonis]MCM6790016.1 MEDS domain-containing protein [Nocardia sp. CDC159]
MRRSGLIQRAQGMGAHDHVCWAFDRPEEFRERAREFLGEGLRLGCQVWYVASEATADDLADIDGWAAASREGGTRVLSVDALYPSGTVVDPIDQVCTYAAATEAALAAGFTGLRVAADATALVRTPAQLAAFTRYEHLVDRYMATQPFSAMCAYRRREVRPVALAQLACLHPNANTTTDFRLFGSAAHSAVLGGELDASSRALFRTTLRRAQPAPTGDRLLIDALDLQFLDHNSLLDLAEYAADRDADLVLRTRWPGVSRLVELLELSEVQVVEEAV